MVTLTPGSNIFQAYAVDTSGNVSATNSVTFKYVVSAPLTVLINGNGTVTPNDNGALLQIGASYSLMAKAAVEHHHQQGDGAICDGIQPDVAGQLCGHHQADADRHCADGE